MATFRSRRWVNRGWRQLDNKTPEHAMKHVDILGLDGDSLGTLQTGLDGGGHMAASSTGESPDEIVSGVPPGAPGGGIHSSMAHKHSSSASLHTRKPCHTWM
eukprot:1409576-Amphidinium_carterae.1